MLYFFTQVWHAVSGKLLANWNDIYVIPISKRLVCANHIAVLTTTCCGLQHHSVPLLPVFYCPLDFCYYQMSFQVMKSRQAIPLRRILKKICHFWGMSYAKQSLKIRLEVFVPLQLFSILPVGYWLWCSAFCMAGKNKSPMLVHLDKCLNNGLIREMNCVLVVPIISVFFAFWHVYNEKLHKFTCWLYYFVGFWLSQRCSWGLRPSGMECGASSRVTGSGRFDIVQWSHIQESKSQMKNQHWTFRLQKLRSSRCLEKGGTNHPVTRHHLPAQKDGDHLVCPSVNM